MLDKDKLAEMPRPENPHKRMVFGEIDRRLDPDASISRLCEDSVYAGFEEGIQAQRELLWEKGWRKVPTVDCILSQLGQVMRQFNSAYWNRMGYKEELAMELHAGLWRDTMENDCACLDSSNFCVMSGGENANVSCPENPEECFYYVKDIFHRWRWRENE